jgi:hypothetical protein
MATNKSMLVATSARTTNQLLDGFIDKFTPGVAKQIRYAHARMKKRWPTAQQMVYDNYNFLVLGFGPTDKPSEAIFSLAASANHVALCFLQGARIPKSLDPQKLLKGSGSTVRSLRLIPIGLIDDEAVNALMEAANAHAKVPMPPAGKSALVIKSISAKQRPRRPSVKSNKEPEK